MIDVRLPELGEGIDKATVTCWYFQPGQRVEKEQDLLELATDKATFNLPSPCSGVLEEIAFSEGQDVQVGEVLARIQEDAP